MKFYVLILLISLFSCKGNRTTFNQIYLNRELESIVKQFVKEKSCNDCLNEIYFDKQTPHFSVITIVSKSPYKNYKFRAKPIFITKIDNCLFYVYTGSEEYIENNDEKKELTLKDINPELNSNVKCKNKFDSWYVVDSFNTLNINKNISYPFCPLPSKFTIQQL